MPSKFFRVATEGATTDGRTIQRSWIEQAADNYNTGKYRAASSRFKKVLEDYPDVGMYNDAMELLAECQAELAESPAPVREGEDITRTDTMGLESLLTGSGAPSGD